MSPFDPNWKGSIPDPSRRERAYTENGRKHSKLMQEKLDKHGPTRVPNAEQKAQYAAKTAKILKGAL